MSSTVTSPARDLNAIAFWNIPKIEGSLVHIPRLPDPDDPCKLLLVFVHGFLGSPAGTWGNMPAWLVEDQPLEPAILAFSYATGPRLRADIRLAASRLRLMLQEQFDAYRHIVFLTHSTGGLVVKELLRQDGLSAWSTRHFSTKKAGPPQRTSSKAVYSLGAPHFARNRVTYHLRAPKNFREGEPWPGLLILHGSNMNTRLYMDTIVAAWPDIAERYILIGINGERRNPDSPAENPRFNYTYVSFVGKSKYQGYPGTDRESPALVAEVIGEIRERVRISMLFVGGHSQGGFLTYSLMMNYPDLVDGAFPISAGLIIQCEPGAYEDADVIARQRQTPLAIVHGTSDGVVSFSSGRYAYEAFEDGGFPMLRLFTDEQAGHRFGLLPVDQAIVWLEKMSSDDAGVLVAFAEEQLDLGDDRSAIAAVQRARALDDGRLEGRIAAVERRIDDAAGPGAVEFADRIASAGDNSWVDGFLEFRSRFQFAAAARNAMESYDELRTVHQPEADRLFGEARGDFQRGDRDAAYAKYQRIVDEFYTSSWYRLAKRNLEDRQ